MQTGWNSDQSFLNSLDSYEPRSPTLCSPGKDHGSGCGKNPETVSLPFGVRNLAATLG